jgi:hypothetical protein
MVINFDGQGIGLATGTGTSIPSGGTGVLINIVGYYTKDEADALFAKKDDIDGAFWYGTQEQFDAIDVKDPNTTYMVYYDSSE